MGMINVARTIKQGRHRWQTIAILLALVLFTVVYKPYDSLFAAHTSHTSTSPNTQNPNEPCDPDIVYRGPAGLPTLRTREQLGNLLERRKLQDGAEVGVQRGIFARKMLEDWPSCQTYHLVDLWAQQKNYEDIANVPDNEQETIYQVAKGNMAKFVEKVQFHRMLSTEAAQRIPDHSLDFVYIDARHDYCGVLEDLLAYYPKLRPGAIMAGHDFMDNAEVQKISPHQDWSVCHDGSIHPRTVKGAVLEFAERHGLVVSVMYGEGAFFPSWMVQKPTRPECITGKVGTFGSESV